MKSIISLFCFILIALHSVGQVNLVPNPSFEDTVFCPTGYGQLHACTQWENYGKTPDYFNSCAPNGGLNVPNSGFGYQFAHTGYAMIGLCPYRNPNSPDGPNCREFAGSTLSSPLQIGTKYYISFFINYSNYHPFQAVASNNVGLNLFTVPFDSANPPPLNNSAILFSSAVIYDSINWIRISGSFIADSAYFYIAIGNFFDDLNTDTISLSNFPDASYYYIDDICLTTDSAFNESWTDISYTHNSEEIISFFPNPTSGLIYIKGKEVLDKILVFDSIGKLITLSLPVQNDYLLDLSRLNKGVYYLRVFIKNEYVVKSIIVTN